MARFRRVARGRPQRPSKHQCPPWLSSEKSFQNLILPHTSDKYSKHRYSPFSRLLVCWLTNPVRLNGFIVPPEPDAGFLLRKRKTVFEFQDRWTNLAPLGHLRRRGIKPEQGRPSRRHDSDFSDCYEQNPRALARYRLLPQGARYHVSGSKHKANRTRIAMKEGTSAASLAICIRRASEDFEKSRSLTFILLRRRLFPCHMNPHGSAGVGNCRRLHKPDCTFRNPNTIASATGKYWRFQLRFLPTILESHWH
jgi:hypothetical protein